MSDSTPSRRRVVAAAAGALLGATAGCAGGSGGGSTATDDGPATTATDDDPATTATDDDPATTATDDDPATTATDDDPTTTATDDGPDLDLREANVVDVAVKSDGDASAFDVTLHHDDDGEDGYANWWQVERLDGTRLGRRELLHAHSEQPFTRSATVEIPDDVACVIVRGHDETHGYGGRAAAVDLASGTSRSVDQGPERRPIDPGECPTG